MAGKRIFIATIRARTLEAICAYIQQSLVVLKIVVVGFERDGNGRVCTVPSTLHEDIEVECIFSGDLDTFNQLRQHWERELRNRRSLGHHAAAGHQSHVPLQDSVGGHRGFVNPGHGPVPSVGDHSVTLSPMGRPDRDTWHTASLPPFADVLAQAGIESQPTDSGRFT